MTDFLDATGVSRKWQAIKKYLSNTSGTKATPVDTDYILMTDSADTESANGTTINKIKRVSFANLSAAIIAKNQSTAAQTGFSALTYLDGSSIAFPYAPKVGTTYRLIFDVTKTAAGTAAPRILIKIGTTGSNADSSRGTIVFGAGTAVADSGIFEVIVSFRDAGESAVVQSIARLTSNLTTTGLSNAKKAVFVTSGAFDSTVAGLYIGAAYDGGTSAAHTIQLVKAELIM